MLTAPTEIIDAIQTAAPAVQGGSEIATWFVCVMGMATVFIGLVSLIILIKIVSLIMGGKASVKTEQAGGELPAAPAPVPVPAHADIPNRGALVAAVSAALAEELGKDVRAIRIVKIEKVA